MGDVNKIKLSLLKLKKGDIVLDMGCSYGEQAVMVARQDFKVVGIDLSEKRIKQLNLVSKKEKLSCRGIKGDITKMPFKRGTFDAVIATEVLEHIENPEAAVREAFRVLKKGSRACFSVPTDFSEKVFRRIHPTWVKDSGHINVFTVKEILSILTKSGFKVLKTEKQNFEWFLFWFIHSLLKSRFDDTGTPTENLLVSKVYFKIWNFLQKTGLAKIIINLGNIAFPKSIYIYLIKV